ncbi:MAG TPA: TnsA endonuclease N-terminal domain-containing protein [Sulfurimonas sp.]|uniref:TnsA endonuclease N-terminal domain-containing protein n=1 Tax=Sulfurimonas sp. TaxID=2022749 RepID=UPI002C8F6F37|nr:TnsA endonuclease N-terminal domain-containing protein [Sulfurimonas sp.]HUH43152.1 TnsA endonuclease N-terminal domain-containing protein [Sulfurimonas sp.]
MEFDRDVVSFEEQPLKINYQLKAKNTRYTPDVLVTYKDGSQKIFEVKYQSDLDSDPQLQHKISVLKEEIARQMSLPFETFTDAQIDQMYFKNCVFLYKNAFISENSTMTNKILENINKLSEPIAIKSFVELLAANQTEQLQILPYLWHRIFKEPSLIDMHKKITMSSLILKGKIHE